MGSTRGMAAYVARSVARVVGRVLLAGQVVAVGIGVSSPAPGVDTGEDKRSKQEQRRRIGAREGERGHVRRRGDVVEKRTHVEKREGWRKVE